jgi:hypothetical protein
MTTIISSTNSSVVASGRGSSVQGVNLASSKNGPLRERMWSTCQIGWSHMADRLMLSFVRQNGHAHVSCQVFRNGKFEQLTDVVKAKHEILDGILHICSCADGDSAQAGSVAVAIDVRGEAAMLLYATTDLIERAGMTRIGLDRPVLMGLSAQ